MNEENSNASFHANKENVILKKITKRIWILKMNK